jgi:response regulator RpfG family c-di-GMP phosphodiesterase
MLEHDEDDRYITQAVFDEHRYNIKLDFVNTSNEIFAQLIDCDKNNRKYPSLILLNYHAAPLNAVQIIQDLKADDRFNHIPVVVLSGSVKSEIIKECYDAGASSFIQKPWKAEETDFKVSNFFRYWFETVELP